MSLQNTHINPFDSIKSINSNVYITCKPHTNFITRNKSQIDTFSVINHYRINNKEFIKSRRNYAGRTYKLIGHKKNIIIININISVHAFIDRINPILI